MHLENLDVELVIESLGNSLHERSQEIDPKAHAARLDDASPARRRRYDLLMRRGEPGRTYDVDETVSRTLSSQRDCGGRNRKVDQAVRLGEQRRRFGAHSDAVATEACQLAGVASDYGGAWRLDCARQNNAIGFGDSL